MTYAHLHTDLYIGNDVCVAKIIILMWFKFIEVLINFNFDTFIVIILAVSLFQLQGH